MRHFRSTINYIIFAIGLQYAAPAFSNTIAQFGVIEVGKPVGYTNSQGEPSGIYADITEHLIADSGINGEIHLLPYPRLVRLMDVGKLDCAIFFTSPERKKNYSQIGLVVKRPIIIIGEVTRHITNSNIHDALFGKNVGRVGASNTAEALHSNPGINVLDMRNYKHGVKMLKLNRIDAFVGAKEVIDELYDYGQTYHIYRVKESWLQCSKKSTVADKIPSFYGRLKQALGELHKKTQDGSIITNIHSKYFKNYQPISVE